LRSSWSLTGAQVQHVHRLGLVEAALGLVLRDDGGQVQVGAGQRGAGDVVDLGDVVVGEGERRVDRETGHVGRPPAGHQHVDGLPVARPRVVEVGGLPVGDDRPVAAGQDGGHVLAAPGELIFCDRAVDPSMDAMKAPAGSALLHRPRAQSDLRQVRQREHKVLLGGQLGELGV
jgi:hypothetical protein